MKITRAQFVSTLASAAAAAVLDPQELLGQGARVPVGVVSAARFRPLVNTSFYVRRDVGGLGIVVELVLTAVEEKDSTGPSEQFTLQLLAVNGTLEEGTYTLEHRSLGTQRLFLAAAGTAPGGDVYRADFNVLRRVSPRAS
jgi:hypothetical protein